MSPEVTTALDQVWADLRRRAADTGRLTGEWKTELVELEAEVAPMLADALPRAAAGDEVAKYNLGLIADLVAVRVGRKVALLLERERTDLVDWLKLAFVGLVRAVGGPVAGTIADTLVEAGSGTMNAVLSGGIADAVSAEPTAGDVRVSPPQETAATATPG